MSSVCLSGVGRLSAALDRTVLLTFQEAAALIGQRSRSCVYRWLNDGWLAREGYLRGEPGRWRIESEPGDGIRPFRQWAAAVLGAQGPIRQSELAPAVDLEIDGSLQFWMEYGRIADPADPPLSGAEFWEHVAAMLGGMVPDVHHILAKVRRSPASEV